MPPRLCVQFELGRGAFSVLHTVSEVSQLAMRAGAHTTVVPVLSAFCVPVTKEKLRERLTVLFIEVGGRQQECGAAGRSHCI